jgi:hypothetical protein
MLLLVAGASLIVALAVAPAAHAEFGVVPGTFLAKAHATVPLQTRSGQGAIHHREINLAAIASSPPVTQAGAHPDASTSFMLHAKADGSTPDDNLKDAVIATPPGFLGNPLAVPACSRVAFVKPQCSPLSQIGVATVTLRNLAGRDSQTYPIYRIATSFGRPASFGFVVAGTPIVLTPEVRSDGDYGLSIAATDLNASAIKPLGATVTLWGVPWDAVHDAERWDPRKETGEFENGAPILGDWGAALPGVEPKPFLGTPAFCASGPLGTYLHIDSWQEIGRWLPADPVDPNYIAASPEPTGCEAMRFGDPGSEAALAFQPAQSAADTPAGYRVRLALPYDEDPNSLANPTLRDTAVTLPEGVALNPSAANGLAACTEAQIGYLGNGFSLPNPIRFDEEPIGCPDASKIGTVEVVTPLLEEPLKGAVYLAKQKENPFGSLLAIYIAIDDAKTGIVVKLAGHVETDPATGRITATFTNNPQLPFTEFKLDFFGGPGASLVNPQTCGTKTTSTVLTPWSAPYTPAVTSTDSFDVTAGANGGDCPQTEAGAPATMSFEAGTTFTTAAFYSPFVIKLSREDGTQRFKALNLTLPQGLTGRLAGTPYCPDAAIAQAEARSRPGEGALELASPSCPAASQVGTVDVAAGAGSTPVHVQGKAYLAGPYKGAQLSMVVITPAVAGPFDLGVVVVRTPLYVNEETAQISARSDAFPSILEGIPLDIRSVAIDLGKPEFTYTPSSCEAMAVTGEATMTTGQVTPLNNRFQVGGCKGLDFAPKLALKVFGKTNRNAKPRLRAVLQAKPGEANIARAQVNLPHSLFLEQNHIKTVCTRVQWTAGAGHGSECPKGSIYGHARAITPLLEKPLEGPVFLRSNGGERKLPDLVAALNGQIDIALWGKVDSGPNHGLRNTFEVVPDAPVSKFILEMRGGKKGLLVNSENLCSKTARKRRAIVRFVGHNGGVESFKPHVANQCGKRHGKKPKAHKRQKAG